MPEYEQVYGDAIRKLVAGRAYTTLELFSEGDSIIAERWPGNVLYGTKLGKGSFGVVLASPESARVLKLFFYAVSEGAFLAPGGAFSREVFFLSIVHGAALELLLLHSQPFQGYQRYAISFPYDPAFGTSLHAYLYGKETQFNLSDILRVLKKMVGKLIKLRRTINNASVVQANGLGHFVHCDISTANIVLDPQTLRVRIIDFGCGHFEGEVKHDLPRNGSVGYITDRRARADYVPKQEDDVYSLLTIMVQALCRLFAKGQVGARFFSQALGALRTRISQQWPAFIQAIADKIPVDVGSYTVTELLHYIRTQFEHYLKNEPMDEAEKIKQTLKDFGARLSRVSHRGVGFFSQPAPPPPAPPNSLSAPPPPNSPSDGYSPCAHSPGA